MTITPAAAERAAAALAGGDHRWEITPEGNLVIMSPANDSQSALVIKIILWLGRTIPAEQLRTEVGVQTVRDGVRGPDVAVFDDEPHQIGPWVTADGLRLVIEVLSPSTRRTDEQEKVNEYAAAGIPSYWMVDPMGGDAMVQRLVLGADHRYHPIEPILLSSLLAQEAASVVFA